MEKPLSGYRIVELADYVSAPVCCRLLADLGAEVIKIERETGNVWRETARVHNRTVLTLEEDPDYDINNTGKKHIVLNLKSPEGLAICHKLLEKADVFVTNTRIPSLKRLGLDRDTLKEKYPNLIYAIGLGYGEKGPEANKPAFDHNAFWARTGFLLDQSTMNDDYYPVFPPSSVGDNFTGMTLALEICAALLYREKTGKGDYVRSSLFHNGIFAMGAMLIGTQPGVASPYPKLRYQHGSVFGDFKCRDGRYIYIAAGYTAQLIDKVFSVIGHEEFKTDERFCTPKGRKENAKELYGIIKDAILSRDSDEWVKFGEECDLPIVRMQHYAEVAHDEQALANGYLQDVVYPSGKKFQVASSPIEMDSVGELTTEPTPPIGRDTEAVLKDAGYTDEELARFRAAGVIN